MAAATHTGAQADAMKSASNTAGAMTGFMGMFASKAPGRVGRYAESLSDGAQRQAAQRQAAEYAAGIGARTWKCECGAENTGKFCSQIW